MSECGDTVGERSCGEGVSERVACSVIDGFAEIILSAKSVFRVGGGTEIK